MYERECLPLTTKVTTPLSTHNPTTYHDYIYRYNNPAVVFTIMSTPSHDHLLLHYLKTARDGISDKHGFIKQYQQSLLGEFKKDLHINVYPKVRQLIVQQGVITSMRHSAPYIDVLNKQKQCHAPIPQETATNNVTQTAAPSVSEDRPKIKLVKHVNAASLFIPICTHPPRKKVCDDDDDDDDAIPKKAQKLSSSVAAAEKRPKIKLVKQGDVFKLTNATSLFIPIQDDAADGDDAHDADDDDAGPRKSANICNSCINNTFCV